MLFTRKILNLLGKKHIRESSEKIILLGKRLSFIELLLYYSYLSKYFYFLKAIFFKEFLNFKVKDNLYERNEGFIYSVLFLFIADFFHIGQPNSSALL